MNMTTYTNKSLNTQSFKKVIDYAIRLAIAAILAGMVALPAVAQDKTLTLDEAIKLGIQNSKVLKLSQSKIDEAISQFNQAKDQALPTGKANFGYSRAQIPANHLQLGPDNAFNHPKDANAYLGTVS